MERRTFLTLLGGAVAGTSQPLAARGPGRPNIVLIMADDMGFSDSGCYGSEVATPNIDRLARGGVRFTHFYNAARCCPTRASLLTGLYSHQAGIGHMVQDYGYPGYRGRLSDHCVTIAEVLRPAGYTTLMSGKWHVGGARPHWPVDRGFDRYFGLIDGGSNYFRPDKHRTMALGAERYTAPENGFYMTDAFTDYAVRFLDEAAKKTNPYFLYLAYTAPHWPLHALPEDIAKYKGRYMKGWDVLRRERHERQIAMGLVDRRWPLTPRDPNVPAWDSVSNKEEWDLRMAVYAAQIDRMDQGIGRVLTKIRSLGQEENTLVMFLADNGACAEQNIGGERPGLPGPADSFTSYRIPWANASNTPFRRYKHWVHEGGIATPFVAYWPSVITRRNTMCRQPAHLIDLMATCVDVGKAPYPKTHSGADIIPLEGKSLLANFEGKRRHGHDALYWEHEGNRAVRAGDWKLVSRHPDSWELYDMAADRTEMNDLASRHPDRVGRMAGMYEAWAKRSNVLPWDEVRRKRA